MKLEDYRPTKVLKVKKTGDMEGQSIHSFLGVSWRMHSTEVNEEAKNKMA